MGFFQNLFGKKTCTLCGAQCGALHRSKIKGGEYVCNVCVRQCSDYVRLSEMDKEQILGHIEYMKRQEKLYQECFANAKLQTYPSPVSKQGIQFADELGMFAIVNRDNVKNKVYHELFRYDQVMRYERYEEIEKASEPGKPDVFKEAGVKLWLVGAQDHAETDPTLSAKGLHTHPYVKREIKVVFHTSAKDTDYSDNAVQHFDFIFGVHDNEKGLFSLGMNKKEKRDLMAGVAAVKTAAAAVKMAKNGTENMTEEQKAEIEANMHAISDAATGGLAQYTRCADAAEEKCWGKA